eukprot:jgi/Psemu1/284189/fgenesh1_pg.44_\
MRALFKLCFGDKNPTSQSSQLLPLSPPTIITATSDAKAPDGSKPADESLVQLILEDATRTMEQEKAKFLNGTHPQLGKIVRMHREKRVRDDECLVCLEGSNGTGKGEPVEIFSTCCGQAYHLSCYLQLLNSSRECGVCRKALPSRSR